MLAIVGLFVLLALGGYFLFFSFAMFMSSAVFGSNIETVVIGMISLLLSLVCFYIVGIHIHITT